MVSDDQQPPPKRPKSTTPAPTPAKHITDQETSHQGTSSGLGKQVLEPCWTAPPKINFKPRSQTKLMQDAQKAYRSDAINEADEAGKVYIPDTFEEESESNSDSFTTRIQKAAGLDIGQSSKNGDDGTPNQTWIVNQMKMTVDTNTLSDMKKTNNTFFTSFECPEAENECNKANEITAEKQNSPEVLHH